MSGPALIAALLIAVAFWMLRPPRAVGTGFLVPVAVVGGWAVASLEVGVEMLGFGAGGVLLTVVCALLVRRRRRAQAARERSQRVREVCELLAADLAAGLPVAAALAGAAEAWPEWEVVIRTEQLGGSAVEAMRDLAAADGAGDLWQVAGAWQLSQRSGSALAAALAEVALGLAEAEQTRRVVRSELASARATARLVAALPVATLAMGSGMGDPLAFLLWTPLGWACLAAGGTLAAAGLLWLDRIAATVERGAW